MALLNRTMADVGALSHLVEAAAALSELSVPVVSRTPTSQTPSVISDDDDQQQQQKHHHSTPSQPPPKSEAAQRAAIAAATAAAAAAGINTRAVKKREIFPQRLMEILADTSLADIITWLPHGRSFVIIRPDLFCEQVLPKYLPPVDSRGSTKYPSFTRKLNRWGFRQATRGADTGAFHHPYFRRDQPELCLEMVCQKSRDRQGSSGSNGSSSKRSLPPKKRVMTSTGGDEETPSPSTSLRSSPTMSSKAATTSSSSPPSAASTTTTSSFNRRTLPIASTSAQRRKQEVQVSPAAAAAATATSSSLTATTATTSLLSSSSTAQAQRMSSSEMDATTTATNAPSPASATASVGKVPLPYISNDKAFVQSILDKRNSLEIIRAAKSQLLHAYEKAVKDGTVMGASTSTN